LVEVTLDTKEGTSKTFVTITSKNSASVFTQRQSFACSCKTTCGIFLSGKFTKILQNIINYFIMSNVIPSFCLKTTYREHCITCTKIDSMTIYVSTTGKSCNSTGRY
jgi:hypothetical protein